MTSVQAAEILGITSSGVNLLAKKGLIHDLGKNKNGHMKHKLKFRAAEIRAFSKVYRKRSRVNKPVILTPKGLLSSGSSSSQVKSKVQNLMSLLNRVENRLSKLESSIKSIEAGINNLNAMWQ